MDAAESSALKRSTVIRLCLPERRSTRLTPLAPVPSVDKVYEMILQDTLQVSLAEQKSREEQEARENVELVNKHLVSEEIEKMMEGSENVINDSLPPRNDEPQILGTRLEPRSDKESPKVESTNDEEVEITNFVIPVNVNEEEDEITDEVKSFDTLVDHLQEVVVESLPTMVDTHIKEQVKKQVLEQVRDQVPVYVTEGLILERQKTKEEMERMIAKAILQERKNIQAEISSQIQKAIDNQIPSQVDATTISTVSFHENDPQLQQQDIAIWLALQMKFENLHVPQTTCRPSAVRPRDQDVPHDDAHPERENSAKRQKTSEYEAYVSGESLSRQMMMKYRRSKYHKIMEEVSLTIGEAKLEKMADEMLRQRCTSRDEHQYHINQMKNFLKSDIVWESRKEILISLHPQKTTPLVQSCQRDPEALTLSLTNQDLLYLKKGSSGPEKIVLSLHKFLVIIFNDDDIEEQTSRWNPHAKIFYIKKQKEPGKPKEEVYSNSKIIQVIKTYWELGHEHKFITEIVTRRVNECIMLITEPDYKNLIKNDIEDMYLLIMNGKVPDYVETGLLWSLSVFIRSSVI
ncbi:hypothetical protein Tco_0811853 [Tanacetum coccineum]